MRVTSFYTKIASSKLQDKPWTAILLKTLQGQILQIEFTKLFLPFQLLNCMLLKSLGVTENWIATIKQY